MSLLRAILYGLWRGLDGLRKFLHLLLLLVVFGFVVGALRVSMPSVSRRSNPSRPITRWHASAPRKRGMGCRG